jgi:predicted GIY-YIG superfamily endonuclease
MSAGVPVSFTKPQELCTKSQESFSKLPESFANYVLECANKKYYVGRTNRSIDVRFAEHLAGQGSEWTKLHRPISVIRVSQGDKWEEDALVLRFMEEKGIENVRGGSYSTVQLSAEHRAELAKKFNLVNDACFKCGKSGHFAKHCTAPQTVLHMTKSHSPSHGTKPPFGFKFQQSARLRQQQRQKVHSFARFTTARKKWRKSKPH